MGAIKSLQLWLFSATRLIEILEEGYVPANTSFFPWSYSDNSSWEQALKTRPSCKIYHY